MTSSHGPSELAKLQAENDRLRAALKPFADIDGLGVTANGYIEIKIPGAILIAARAAHEQKASGEVK